MKHWRLVYLAIPLTVIVFWGIMWSNSRKSQELCEGVGRATAVYMTAGSADQAHIAEYRLETYTEGQGEAPVWWDPDEEMAVEWVSDNTSDNARLSHSVDYNARRDVGCPDYNVETVIYGWDGHTMESWEMDLYARIVYLEVWGKSRACCEAVADSILVLWDSEYFGSRISDTLTATAEDGSLAYSPYAYVWDWDYDLQGLADMKALCEERFSIGPQYTAPYFRLWYYHPWAVDAYTIDNVYFSRSKE